MNSQTLRVLSPFALLFSVLLLLTFPSVSYAVDTDGDGFDDTIDADKDGDGIPNAIEDFHGLNPLLFADGALDLDSDGWSNADEYRFGTGIDDAADSPQSLGVDRLEKVFAADGAGSDNFGYSVSVSGDTAVIGSFEDDSFQGSAYVFVRSNGLWSLQQKLIAADGATGDNFGWSVSISGETVLVGAYLDDTGFNRVGSAYVFVRNGVVWSQQRKLTGDGTFDGVKGEAYGYSVSVSDDTVVVGAPFSSVNGTEAGAVYVYFRTGSDWAEQAALFDGGNNDTFGWSVSVSGDTAVIGAVGDDDKGSAAGAAYVFFRSDSNWTQQQKLTASDGAAVDLFGWSVSVSGGVAVIGAKNDSSKTGSSYVFVRNGAWSEQQKLTASDGDVGDEFGYSVSVSGDMAVIGARGDSGSTGSSYVFVRSTGVWSEQQKLTEGDGEGFDSFGISVSVSENTVVIGAHGDGDLGIRSGAAYLLDLDIDDDGVLNNRDADIDGDGIPNTIETLNGLDPLNNADGPLDLDVDGWSNADEYRFGSDIDDIASNPPSLGNNRTEKVFASDGAEVDQFGGSSVSVSGNTAVIGAIGDDDSGSNSGSAYVFTHSAGVWSEQQKLTTSDGGVNHNFGGSVSVSGNTAVIGAIGDDVATGAAYVFVRSAGEWGLQQKLTATDGADLDQFGTSVSVSGDTAVIGARGDDDAGESSGAAYVFTRSGVEWVQQQKLVALDRKANESFGISVSVSGEVALIGAAGDVGDNGSAYVFVRSGVGVNPWDEEQKLTADDGAADDDFGSSVSISGETAVIGARGDDDGGSFTGSAYVFVRSGVTWSQQQKLNPSDAATSDRFGTSVSVSGDTALIGASFDDAITGSAYVFTRSAGVWSQQDKLIAGDGAAGDRFGSNVSISGDAVVMGAPSDDDSGDNSGSAYLLDLDIDNDGLFNNVDADIDGDGIPNAIEIANDLDPHHAADGALDLDDDGWSNADEYRFGTGINDDTSNPLSLGSNRTEKVFAADGAAGDKYGYGVFVAGDTAVIGAFEDDGNTGSAYVFVRSAGVWSQQQKLTADDGAVDDRFGESVSVFGDTAVIGARGDDTNTGAAYVFVRNVGVWTQQQKLTAVDGEEGDRFGVSVSIFGDRVVVGAPVDDSATGSAHIFIRDGDEWFLQRKLTANGGEIGDFFGVSVSVANDTVVIGAFGDDSFTGSAYVIFNEVGVWTQRQKLTADDGAVSDRFGNSVSINGDTVVVGASRDNSLTGAAYVFVRGVGVNPWSQQQKLTADDGAPNDEFGLSVSISGDMAVIGAPVDDNSTGSAYVFTRSAGVWSQQDKLFAADGAANDQFGFSVSVSDETVVMGAPGDADSGNLAGSAYFINTSDHIYGDGFED